MSLVTGISNALTTLAMHFNKVLAAVNDLESNWTIFKVDNRGFKNAIYIAEKSRTGLRIKRVLDGEVSYHNLTEEDNFEATWQRRILLEYGVG